MNLRDLIPKLELSPDPDVIKANRVELDEFYKLLGDTSKVVRALLIANQTMCAHSRVVRSNGNRGDCPDCGDSW